MMSMKNLSIARMYPSLDIPTQLLSFERAKRIDLNLRALLLSGTEKAPAFIFNARIMKFCGCHDLSVNEDIPDLLFFVPARDPQ